MTTYTKKQVKDLVSGELDWDSLHQMLSMPKDKERYGQYIEVLQEQVSWNDRILLPLGPHLYIVESKDKSLITKCSCGHDFGDYRQNWKLNALVYVRDSEEKMNQVYPKLMAPHTDWQVYREYYCPTCGTMHDVEAPTPWYPVIHDFQPDLKAFFDWLDMPAPVNA
ncbi:acetone carboxylase subunit gamma [Marinobacterium zhoushanense]|uniref:Acetone carboxylase subunit gamma n=1 Tax=Marinobacterium zhoushanense TaxID=1679163 RepID=A0ABQ1KGV5_9GAMM|nr:acetone carboxylase subunit gamma [Marinobacterium zhoushanense]GGB95841.1 acetone carboxylase subunit gamma [Marinobacterium zhoushanense]